VTIPVLNSNPESPAAGPYRFRSARAGAGLGRHLYRPAAFYSPIALVVVAAIGLAACSSRFAFVRISPTSILLFG